MVPTEPVHAFSELQGLAAHLHCPPGVLRLGRRIYRRRRYYSLTMMTLGSPNSPQGNGQMNAITLASRKGGVGESTLTAHLAACAHLMGHRCMVVDADPQGSLTLWDSMRADSGLVLQNAAQGINRIVASALLNGYQWVFIATAPATWLVVQEAIRAATIVVIPVRDRARSQQALCGGDQRRPVKREDKEAPAVALSRAQFERLSVPVWSGQIRQRTAFLGSLAVGASTGEIYGDSGCKLEIARLWSAIERSVDAINAGRRRGQSDLT
jgi:chromosome partitioning protein